MKASARLLTIFILIAATSLAQTSSVNTANTPVTRNTWLEAHSRFCARASEGNLDLLFIGDSITAGWAGNGKQVWQDNIAPLNAANFGIGGDRTQHLLWRLQNGELNGISPKVAVLMIGTNNMAHNTPEEIASGVLAIIDTLKKFTPKTRILLLAIFPRGEKFDHEFRAKIAQTNALIAKFADAKTVHYLDINSAFFTTTDGTLTRDIMPDFLHLSPKGYTLWFAAMKPALTTLLAQ